MMKTGKWVAQDVCVFRVIAEEPDQSALGTGMQVHPATWLSLRTTPLVTGTLTGN